MEDEKKQEQEQERQSKQINDKVKEHVEEKINKLMETGIQAGNVDYLYKLIDIHKDIENEEYWEVKKEGMRMRYRDNYGRDEYGAGDYGNYGIRRRDSRGRYMARGYDTKYRGEEMLEDMHNSYNDYSDSREEYGRGNYGAKEDTMKSLDYMLKSVVQFMQMLEEDATSEEEMQLIKKYARRISEM